MSYNVEFLDAFMIFCSIHGAEMDVLQHSSLGLFGPYFAAGTLLLTCLPNLITSLLGDDVSMTQLSLCFVNNLLCPGQVFLCYLSIGREA